MSVWRTSRFGIDLDRPRVMGIVNVTPDSFSDGGTHADAAAAIAHAGTLLRDGADILDIGGESTRPGATPVTAQEELARVMPVVGELVRWGVPISVDTSRAEVIQACLDAGIDIVNDVRSLRLPGAQAAVAGHPGCGVCLMHMRGEPKTMQAAQHGQDGDAVMVEVADFLAEHSRSLVGAGVGGDRIVVDPGIGFGKSVAENLALLRRQHELLDLGFPILAGWSRKSTLGAVTGATVDQRMAASVSAALLAALNGARILRVHDVKETVEALKVWQATGMFAPPQTAQGELPA